MTEYLIAHSGVLLPRLLKFCIVETKVPYQFDTVAVYLDGKKLFLNEDYYPESDSNNLIRIMRPLKREQQIIVEYTPL